MQKPQGMSTIQVLLIILLVFLLGTGVFLFVREERARTRDAKRMADMARLSSAFFELYLTEGSYETAALNGCNEAGMSVAKCNLSAYLSDISKFKDPSSGAYTVQGVPGEASFVVTFSLERNYDGFSQGQHVLTADGIK